MTLSDAHPLAISGFVTVALALITLQIAYFQVRIKNYKLHKQIMKLSIFLNAFFLLQYIIRFLLGEETSFPGPKNIRNFIYIPLLVGHISLSIVVIIMIVKHVLEVNKHEKTTKDGNPYFKSPYRKNHKNFGFKVYLTWSITFVAGIIVFILLYLIPY